MDKETVLLKLDKMIENDKIITGNAYYTSHVTVLCEILKWLVEDKADGK